MSHVKDGQPVRPQRREGPLGGWIDAFADWAKAQGYARCTAHRKVLLAVCFSQWLEQEEIGIADIQADHAARYLEHRMRKPRPRRDDRASLQHFTDFLRQEGVLSFEDAPADPMTDAERCVQAYERYLQQTRGLAPATRANYVPFVRSFLRHRFDSGPVTLSSVDADDVVRFVQHMAPRLRPKRAKLLATALRSFLRYACLLGEADRELVAAVPEVASWSMAEIPRGISADQVRKLLASIDRGSAVGRRGYAILMLLARLGLRAGEVRLLELDDIDWTSETLALQSKGGRRKTFPLSEEVGEAIADYLRHGRPPCPSRRVFLRVKAPIKGFRSSGISRIVRCAIKRAGVDAPTCGAHQFRHGLATEMLNGGARSGRPAMSWGTPIPTPPGSTPRSTWRLSARWPLPGREVSDEHASRSRPRLHRHAAQPGLQA